jgi:hypothetical protein
LAVGFARIAQDQAKDPGLLLRAVGLKQGGAGTKIHLHLFARFHFNASNELAISAAQAADVAHERLIQTTEGDLDAKILVNPLGAQTRLALAENERGVILATAFAPLIPGGPKWVILHPSAARIIPTNCAT